MEVALIEKCQMAELLYCPWESYQKDPNMGSVIEES